MAALRHRTTRNTALSFAMMPSTVEMYHDFFQPGFEGADVMAATQTGKTELYLQLALYSAGWRGRTTVYVLPTSTKRNDFVHRRVDEPIRTIQEYNRLLVASSLKAKAQKRRDLKSLRLKRFGRGILMLLSAATPSDFSEYSCDTTIIDEFDECLAYPKNVAKAKNRLRNSPDPQFFRLANPHMEGWGIDEAFKTGDGRRFHWQCDHCGERQPIDWEKNVVRKTDAGSWVPRDRERYHDLLISGGKGPDIRPCCRRCDRPFERDPRGACWVAERPGRRRSYRMSRVDVLSDRLWDLWVEFEACKGRLVALAEFSSGALGKPHDAGGMRLVHAMLERCATGGQNQMFGGPDCADGLQVMGCDVGADLNITIDRVKRHPEDPGLYVREALCVCAVRTFDEAQRLIDSFNVSYAVFDALPETRKVKEVIEYNRARRDRHVSVFACTYFPTTKIGTEDYGRDVNWAESSVRVDRTQLLDAAFEEIAMQERIFPGDAPHLSGWSDQMCAPKRVLSEDGSRYIWDEGDEADHYRHADAYARVAADLSQAGAGFAAG